MTQVVSLYAEDDLPRNQPSLLEEVQDTLHFVASLKHKTFVVKLGGSTLTSQRAVLQDLVWLHELGVKGVLVHGGGPAITAWLQKLGIPTRFEQGLRVTDAQTLEVVRMVLCGHINQDLVALASELGGDVVGLCGTDGKMVQAHIANERLGLVGEIDSVDASLVLHMIDLLIGVPSSAGAHGVGQEKALKHCVVLVSSQQCRGAVSRSSMVVICLWLSTSHGARIGSSRTSPACGGSCHQGG